MGQKTKGSVPVRLLKRFATKTLDLIYVEVYIYGRRDTGCPAQCRAICILNNKKYGGRTSAAARPPS